MTSPRDAFLQRVRQAVAAGNRAGDAAPLPDRGAIGYQGAGDDPAARFCAEWTANGGQAHLVADDAAAVTRILELLKDRSARRVLLSGALLLDRLNLAERLRAAGFEVTPSDALSPVACREPFFAADAGITGVDYLVAETGSVVLLADREEPRSVSLLPPVHIAVAERGQLLADLFDLFDPQRWRGHGAPPSCLTVITGPSKTGDIELRLVTGVHGPGEVHVILVDSPRTSGEPRG
jgi:L-lactate utilization protein LutC